jgi:hypothetical protein
VAQLQTALWSRDPAANRRYFEWKYEANPWSVEPRVHLALRDGELVGMRGCYESRWEVGAPAQTVSVPLADDFVVAIGDRKRGVATQIMQAVIADLADSGIDYVFSLSAGMVTMMGSLALGWRSAGRVCACSTRWPDDDLTGKPANAGQNSTRLPVPCEHSTKVRARPRTGNCTNGAGAQEPGMGVAPLSRGKARISLRRGGDSMGARRARSILDFIRGVLALSGALAIAGPTTAEPLLAEVSDVSARPPDYPTMSSGRQSAKVVFVTGVVDAIDKDFLGRPQKVAIVSLSDSGALLQNPVENSSAGQELKHHVGDDVTARGVVLVKADGSMSLLVDAFQVLGEEGGFVGDSSHREY